MSPLANVFNDPTQYDLEILHVLEDEEFPDILCVWQRKSDGALLYAQDQAGEENEPFENYHSVEDLFILEPETYLDFDLAASSFVGRDDSDVVDAVLADIKRRLNLVGG